MCATRLAYFSEYFCQTVLSATSSSLLQLGGFASILCTDTDGLALLSWSRLNSALRRKFGSLAFKYMNTHARFNVFPSSLYAEVHRWYASGRENRAS